jgi:hypothetical protein
LLITNTKKMSRSHLRDIFQKPVKTNYEKKLYFV